MLWLVGVRVTWEGSVRYLEVTYDYHPRDEIKIVDLMLNHRGDICYTSHIFVSEHLLYDNCSYSTLA